jgi:hypothetical protein
LGPKKSRFQGPPLQTLREMDSPHPNPYDQPRINNMYIGNFMDKRQETRDFRANSEMVYYKRVRSLRGRIKGVEGWEGGELEGDNKLCQRGESLLISCVKADSVYPEAVPT